MVIVEHPVSDRVRRALRAGRPEHEAIVAPTYDWIERAALAMCRTVRVMAQNPRDWTPPPGTEGWEREADGSKIRRRTAQMSTAIKWMWVAAFVILAVALIAGAL